MNKIDLDLAAEKVNGNIDITRILLEELYNAEIIRFDDAGNPYWEANGDPLDEGTELVFE